MSRRYDALSNLLGSIIKGEQDFILGKIQWHICGYFHSDKGYTNPQSVFFKPFENEGRMVSLRRKRTVANCPLQKGGFPKLRGGIQTPKSICDKCEFRKPKLRCAKLQELRQSHKPGSTTAGIVAEALSQTEKMIGGSK